jgi:hypothetical protein
VSGSPPRQLTSPTTPYSNAPRPLIHSHNCSVSNSNVATLSPGTVNETRGQFTRSKLAALPTDPTGPAVSISGVASFGGSPTCRVNNLYELADNLSHRAGAHALRFGADFLYNDTTITYPRSIRGAYTFSSLANFLTGTYNNSGFTQTFGNSAVAQTNPSIGFYAQDEWKISSRLTLNIGARYDLQYIKRVATDTNNFSPRAGFPWSPFASRRTVVRGSFGLFYDCIPLRSEGQKAVIGDLRKPLAHTLRLPSISKPAKLSHRFVGVFHTLNQRRAQLCY